MSNPKLQMGGRVLASWPTDGWSLDRYSRPHRDISDRLISWTMTETRKRSRKARKPPIELELRLLEWGPRGSTRAEHEGRTLLVDRGIPGEDVHAMVDRRRQSWRGVVEEVVRASPGRRPPPCPYYLAGCGGCQWQHLDDELQVETKRALVDRAMEAAGVSARVRTAHQMSDPWRYRHTAAIAIGWEAGFRPRARHGILEIHDCLISHPLIGRLADKLNDALRAGKLPNYHGKVWLDCTVVGSRRAPALQVLIQGIEGLTEENHPELPEVARTIASLSAVASVSFRHRSGRPVPLVGDLIASIEVAGRDMYLPAGSFFQTNLDMVPRVLAQIAAVLEGVQPHRMADIYGGVGTFGLPLASHVDEMILLELDPLAVAAARATAESWGLRNVEFIDRHAERALEELPPLDAAVVDPPRSGLGRVVTDAILRNGVPLLFYVSCSPQSLARDLADLASAYRVESLDIFDFYPQTYHVESLAVLRRC